jgi:PAS domain S-box-containing protein
MMKDHDKTREQLIHELSGLRRRIEELEEARVGSGRAEGEMPEREERLVPAFFKSAIPMALTTIEEGRYIEVNDAFTKVMGVKRENMVGATSTGIGYITPEQRSFLLQELRDKGSVENLELQVRTKEGEVRYGLFNSTKVRMGRKSYLLTMVTDITERRLAENALKESEERFRRLHEASFGGICIHDNGLIVEANEALASMIGYSRHELIGMNGLGFVAPESRDMVTKSVLSGDEAPYEVAGIRKDGSVCYLEVQGKAIPFGGRQLRVAEFRDITERKRSEEAFRESETRYRELCDSLPEIVSEFDGKGNFVFVNQNGFRIFGYTKEDFDKGLNVFQMVAPEDRPRLESSIGEILRSRQTAGNEYKMIRKDGSAFYATAYTNPIVQRDRVVGYRTILIDISDRKEAEEALRRSETRYRTLLESINDGVYILDNKGRFTFVNDVIVRRTGRSRDWFLGRRFLELIRPEFRELVQSSFEAEMRGEVIPPIEISVIYAEPPARNLWVEVNTKPLYDGDRIVGLLGTSRDITARKHTEEELRKSEERFRRLAENARDMIYRKSLPDGEYQYVSPASADLTGYMPEHFYHDPLLARKVVHPDWSHYFDTEQTRLRKGRTPAVYEYKIIHKSGEERWLYQRDVLVSDDAGNPVAIEGMVTDISERKRTEEALKDSEEKYRSIFERSPLGIFQTTLEGAFIRVNPALARMLGYGAPRDVIDSASDLAARIFVKPGQMNGASSEAPGNDGQRVYESEYFRKDGGKWVGHLTLSVIHDEEGTPHHLDGIVEDVTEKKMMEEKLQSTMERLRALSRRLLEVQEAERRYIARELHDEIGQTLTALRISLKRAERSNGPGPAGISINESVKMVEGLIKQVRNLSIELRPSILDDFGLTAALDWYVNRLSVRAGLEAEFHTAFKDERFSPLIELTCFRIAQEALTNIVRHSGATKVRVDLETRGEELHLTVSDDGGGFDVSKKYKKAIKGKTFGLIGMEERASLAGGRLEFTSRSGEGTVVHASFPLRYFSGSA